MRTTRAVAGILWSFVGCVGRVLVFAILLTAIPCAAGSRTERVNLFPKLQAGQTITYQIRYHVDKDIKTLSTVVSPLGPSGAQIDVRGLLRVKVIGVQSEGGKGVIHAQAQFETFGTGADQKAPGAKPPQDNPHLADPKAKIVEFTIVSDGRVADVNGLDAFFPEQQQTWGAWVSLFAMTAAFPEKGVKLGEKWNFEEAEKSSAPLAGLVWMKRSTYVRDEPCRAAQLTIEGRTNGADQTAEACAVILTTATLKQKSSRKKATPEDFKLHELQTTGTARGTNQVIAYISLKTGLVVRATEEASQSMDVVIAKIDGTNRVNYHVDATSNSEVLLVAGAP